MTHNRVGHEFYVLMQKRKDGIVYADLHKTDEKMYLVRTDAERVLQFDDLREYKHIVKMVAYVAEDQEGK